MELEKALDQIHEIHQHLTKSEVYRGYRAVPIALSGVVAIASAVVQPKFMVIAPTQAFVAFWVAVAVAGSLIAGGGIAYNYLARYDRRERRRTRTVLGQLLPCLVAGVIVTGAIAGTDHPAIAFLPGLWTVLFGLGIFASRPYLPRIIGFVALFYLVAGAVLLAMAGQGNVPSPWGMGLTFGIGQIMAAIVLYRDLERKENGYKV